MVKGEFMQQWLIIKSMSQEDANNVLVKKEKGFDYAIFVFTILINGFYTNG